MAEMSGMVSLNLDQIQRVKRAERAEIPCIDV